MQAVSVLIVLNILFNHTLNTFLFKVIQVFYACILPQMVSVAISISESSNIK